MIRVIKLSQPPDVLRMQRARRRGTHCANYTRYANDYDSGAKTFRFAFEIYADASVQAQLVESHHGKCCFCERSIGGGGDVEHFRPKGGYCQTAQDEVARPGYYWLAYDWDNLLYACKECNQKYKGNQFPLFDPSQRARNHHADLSLEQPQIIHPCLDEPEQYIGFRGTEAYAIDGNSRGEATIQACGLNSEDLNEARREHLLYLLLLKDVLDLEAELPKTAEGYAVIEQSKHRLTNAVADRAEFASAARCAIETNFRFVPEDDAL